MERVLAIISPLIVRYCRARLGSGRPVVRLGGRRSQEVCLAVVTSLAKYRVQGRPFLAFVYGTPRTR